MTDNDKNQDNGIFPARQNPGAKGISMPNTPHGTNDVVTKPTNFGHIQQPISGPHYYNQKYSNQQNFNTIQYNTQNTNNIGGLPKPPELNPATSPSLPTQPSVLQSQTHQLAPPVAPSEAFKSFLQHNPTESQPLATSRNSGSSIMEGNYFDKAIEHGSGQSIPGEGKRKNDKDSYANLPLGQKLLARGLISKDQLETVLKEQKNQGASKKMLGAILVEMGFITESALGEILTESSGIKSFDIKKSVLDPNLIKKVPREVATRCKALPVSLEDEIVRVAITDIYNIIAIDQIRKYFPEFFKIVPVYSSESSIIEAIEQYYG